MALARVLAGTFSVSKQLKLFEEMSQARLIYLVLRFKNKYHGLLNPGFEILYQGLNDYGNSLNGFALGRFFKRC